MRITRDKLMQMLRAQGDNTLADRIAAKPPEEIATWLEAAVLASSGLDQTHTWRRRPPGCSERASPQHFRTRATRDGHAQRLVP